MKGNQSGLALIMVMMTILILEIICFFLSHARGIQTKITFNRIKRLKSQYIAQGGLAHGLWRIQEDPNWQTQMSNLPLGDGYYTIAFAKDDAHRRLTMSSQGNIQGTISSVARNVHWLTIQPQASGYFMGEDTYLVEGSPDTRFDVVNPAELRLDRKAGGRERILVRFNLAKYPIPADCKIIAGRFALFLFEAAQSFTDDAYRIHRITNTWSVQEATWNSRASGYSWNLPGGDFESDYEDSLIFTTLGWQKWRSTGLARYWIQNPGQNRGLTVEAPPVGGTKEFKFRSSANTVDPGLSPKLTLYYLDQRSP